MFYHDINPILAEIGPFQIRYYGLIFVFGILLSYFFLKWAAKKRGLPLSGRDFDDGLIYGIIGVIAGARLGSVISNAGYYVDNPLQVFAIWEGGLAFHGALMGLAVTGYIYCRQKKIRFYDVADIIVIPVALALGVGRIGNFINGEFYGIPTELPWGVKFPNVEGFRHPVQIYEAMKNFLIFGILWALRNKNLPGGTLFWSFIVLYGGIRFALEFYKDIPPLLFGITWGQIWSLPMLALGIYMLYKLRASAPPGKNAHETPEKPDSVN